MRISRSPGEIEIMHQMLSAVADWKPRGKYKDICGFMAMIGDRAGGDLMVVGRAVNGWGLPWSPAEYSSLEARERILHGVLKSVEEGADGGMRWLTAPKRGGYNPNTSAFQRVMKRVAIKSGIPETENGATVWPLYVIWSNLYKIAPCVLSDSNVLTGGNPNSQLGGLQRGLCSELLRVEIKTYMPTRVLFLTGVEWFEPFKNDFPGVSSFSSQTFEMETGDISHFWADGHTARVVVAPHPQGKQEDKLVSDILRAFGEARN